MREIVPRFGHIKMQLFAFVALITLLACDNSNDMPVISLISNGHLKYIAVEGGIQVYDMDHGHKPVKMIPLPEMFRPEGIAANAVTDRLYIPYHGNRTNPKTGQRAAGGFLLCMDLKTDQILWRHFFEPSIDSLAITVDGKTLYMPSGENSEDAGFWFVIDAISGKEITRIPVYKGAHNTIMSPNQPRVYLASLQNNFLFIANTETNQVIGKIGPFGERIRPFAINGRETLAFVTVNYLSGFEVADLERGRVLHRVEVEGFPWVEHPPLPRTQSHGIALTPDEKEVWVVDAFNRYVHVFDVRGLPYDKPRQIADIDVKDPANPSNLPKWINMSRDGSFAHVSTGAIIDTKSRKIITTVVPSRYFIQIDIENREPVNAYSRYGIGYTSIGARGENP